MYLICTVRIRKELNALKGYKQDKTRCPWLNIFLGDGLVSSGGSDRGKPEPAHFILEPKFYHQAKLFNREVAVSFMFSSQVRVSFCIVRLCGTSSHLNVSCAPYSNKYLWRDAGEIQI